jgi:hypothetical protein
MFELHFVNCIIHVLFFSRRDFEAQDKSESLVQGHRQLIGRRNETTACHCHVTHRVGHSASSSRFFTRKNLQATYTSYVAQNGGICKWKWIGNVKVITCLMVMSNNLIRGVKKANKMSVNMEGCRTDTKIRYF